MIGKFESNMVENSFEREFQMSWTSPTAWIFNLVCVIGLVLLFLVVALPGSARWMLFFGALTFFGFAWLLSRQLFSKVPVLRINSEGIGAAIFKGETIPWNQISNVTEMSTQGMRQILVTITPKAGAPTPSFWTAHKNQKCIPLGPIRSKDQNDVLPAVLQGFFVYGGTQLQQAIQRSTDDMLAATVFEERLKTSTPITWALYLVVAINLGVWIANITSGLNAMKPLPVDLFRWGANSTAAVVEDSQYWRLLTATFLHGGLMHLLFNMLGLWEAGKQLNKFYGNAQFLLIYIASALTGSCLSLHFSALQSVSVGASGAVFGVLGALLVAMYQHRSKIPAMLSKNVITSQAVFLSYALIQGFAKQGIDNAAHVGGLVAGGLLAFLLIESFSDDATTARRRQRAIAGVLSCFAICVALIKTSSTPLLHHRQLFEFQSVMTKLQPSIQQSNARLQTDVVALKEGKLTQAEFTEALRSKHLVAFEEIRRLLLPLGLPASDMGADHIADIKLTFQLMAQMIRLEIEIADQPEKNTLEMQSKLSTLSNELKLVSARNSARNQPTPSTQKK
jgi:rhomboid protease GluP